MMKHDVIIAGGGISGLVAGIRLVQLGLQPVVIERQTLISTQLKGDYLQPSAVELLKKIGLLDLITQDRACAVPKVSYTISRPLTNVRLRYEFFYEEQNSVDHGLAVAHENLIEILRDEYLKLGGILKSGVSMIDIDPGLRTWAAFLSTGEELRASAFIGADGRHSESRKSLNVPLTEFSSQRMMMAAVLKRPNLSQGDFHFEEIDEGALFALRLPDKSVRVYICFRRSEIPLAYQNRSDFFFEKCRGTSLFSGIEAKLESPPLLMPTVDAFLQKRSLGTGIWIGDAAGTLDPLSGQGLSIAVAEAIESAEIIHASLSHPKLLTRNLEIQGAKAMERYLHARFFGLWAGEFLMGGGRVQQVAKWHALNRAAKSKQLKVDLLNFFSGRRQDPIGLYDLPWLLGLLPKSLHEKLQGLRLNQTTLLLQDLALTTPMLLKKRLFQEKAANFISKF